LEVTKPLYAVKVALVRASTHALELSWTATTFAAAYVLQIQKIEQAPSISTKQSNPSLVQQNLSNVASALNGSENIPLGSSLAATAALKFEKSPISVLHLSGTTATSSAATTLAKATITSSGPDDTAVSLVSAVSTSSKTSLAPTTTLTTAQPQISIISSSVPGGNSAGILQKFRPNTSKIASGTTSSLSNSSTSTTTTSVVAAATTTSQIMDNQNLAVRVASTVAPSGGIVLTSQTSTGALRIIPGVTASTGQTLRLASTYNSSVVAGAGSTTTTMLKSALPTTSVQQTTSTPTATSLGGKQYFIQKPLTLAPNVQLQFVKTSSGGMAVQTLPKVNFNITKGSASHGQAISICNQQLSTGSTQIQVGIYSKLQII